MNADKEFMANEQKRKDWKFYVDELKSDQCFCERSKKPGLSFCYRCYRALPFDMQRAIYRRLGNGYEEAYDQAVIYLSQEVL